MGLTLIGSEGVLRLSGKGVEEESDGLKEGQFELDPNRKWRFLRDLSLIFGGFRHVEFEI